MNILVTGGAGYIGSNTVETLIERGHKVVVLDNLSSGYKEAVHPQASFVQADIADTDTVTSTLKTHNIEAVMHFAAFIEVGESMKNPIKYFENNTLKTFTLLSTLVQNNIQKFVFSSTAALFGNPESVPIAETARIQPESVYGETKYQTERILYWLSQTKNLGYTALRYFNASGAGETYGENHKPESHLIPLVLQVAQGKRDSISIYGDDYDTPDGTCVRDYIHVKDLANAHVLAIEALQPGQHNAYNLGNGQGFSVKQVIDICRDVTGHPIPTTTTPRRAGDPAILVADSSLIRQELGWVPERPELKEIVASAWAWFEAHPDGY